MIREAILSDGGRYRYRLTRSWGERPSSFLPISEKRDVWVMLNPSTADADLDDPTIRRCMGFSRSWGANGIEVVNLFPWRATKPKDLLAAMRAGEDVVSRDRRNHHIGRVFGPGGVLASRVIVAWGAAPWAGEEGERLRGWAMCPDLLCLGTNANGSPKHPLYLPATAELREWARP